jgi:hypothetical protein
MINVFSAIVGIVLFLEVIIVVALLKPVKEPYYIRNVWCNLQENSFNPSKLLGTLVFCLFLNTFMDMSWETNYYKDLLIDVDDGDLVLEFYFSKMSMCYLCFFIVLFLFVLIERTVQSLSIIARLLEFELMCRHAILSRDSATQTFRTMFMLSNIYEVVRNYERVKRIHTYN